MNYLLVLADNPLYKSQNITRLSDTNAPLWIQDEDLGKTNLRHLNSDENEFWKGLIDTYIKPLRDNPEQREKIERDLINLRNKVSLFFFLSNALLIVVIFTLQYINSENEGYGLAIPIPCETIYGRLLTIEPISLVFMVVFGIALGIQFIAMFFHRMATFWHIMATTDASFSKAPKLNASRMEARDGIQLALDVMSHNDDDDDTKSVTSISTVDSLDDSSVTTDDSPKFKRRKTVQNIARKKKTPDHKGSLSTLFADKLVQLADELHEDPDAPASSTAGGGSGKKRTSSKKAALLNKLKHNKSFVLSKADSVRSKWKKIAARAREKEAPPTNSWQALVQAALRQSRTSLASISEEGLHGLDTKTNNLHANSVVTQSGAGLASSRANSYVSQASNSSHDLTQADVIFEDDGDAESVIDVYEVGLDNTDESSVAY